MNMKTFFSARIREFPLAARSLILGFLVALGLAYVYAFANIALVVGLTPKAIMVHYYGSTAKIEMSQSKSEQATGEQELSFDDLEQEATKAKPILRPSLKNLVAEGHFHLFGMSSFFFGLTLLGLFVGIAEKWKALLVSVPYFSVIIDNLSFMATRFLGPQFAFLTVAAGALMGICFTILWGLIFRELIIAVKDVKE